MAEKLLEVSIVAKRLTVSVDTVRRMIKDESNPLKGIRVGRRCFRVLESSVESVLELRKTNQFAAKTAQKAIKAPRIV